MQQPEWAGRLQHGSQGLLQAARPPSGWASRASAQWSAPAAAVPRAVCGPTYLVSCEDGAGTDMGHGTPDKCALNG